jgi:hypothetical protein
MKVTTGGEDVEGKRGDDQLSIADLVDDDAADDDSEAEADEAHAADLSELRAGEAEVGAPVIENAAAIAKPTPAARMAMKPAQRSRFALGAMPGSFVSARLSAVLIIGLWVWVWGLVALAPYRCSAPPETTNIAEGGRAERNEDWL